MKHIIKAAGLIALTLSLTAAATPGQRYRYLGKSQGVALLVGDATGPATARAFSTVIGVPEDMRSSDVDSFVATISANCNTGMIQLTQTTAYAGAKAMPTENNATDPVAAEAGTPYGAVFDFVCKGKAPEGKPVFVEGADAARAYALNQVAQ